MSDIPAKSPQLSLLGGFSLQDAQGDTLALPTRKTEMLLAYLAIQPGQFHDRDSLATLFWGRSASDQANGSLRKALSTLRLTLGPIIVLERGAVSLAPDRLICDFDLLTVRISTPPIFEPVPLREFLAGYKASTPELEDWLTFERTRCRNHAQLVLMAQSEALLGMARYDDALTAARQLLSLDSLREESHRLIMRIHAAVGERPAALAQFRVLENILKRELAVSPSVESQNLYREISVGQVIEPSKSSVATDFRISIAVLAFQAGNDAEDQAELAAGLSQDILTELSKRRDFMVIAPQSSFTLSSASVREAADALGVRYVLSGSLRRADERFRITAQLADANMGRIVWAERFDRPAADLFAIQDEVIDLILGATDAQIRQDERDRVARRHPDSLDAWEAFHRGTWHAYRFTKPDSEAAAAHFSRATELAPNFAPAHAGLGYLQFVSINFHFTQDVGTAIKVGLEHASHAVALDDYDAFSHVTLGRLLILAGQNERARYHLTRSIALNPSYSQAHFGIAMADFWGGAPELAMASLDRAEKLSPRDPLMPMFLTLRAFCHLWLGDAETAETMARQSVSLSPTYTWSRLALAVSLAIQGKELEAGHTLTAARRIDPSLSIASFDAAVGKVPDLFRDKIYEILRSIGMPEGHVSA